MMEPVGENGTVSQKFVSVCGEKGMRMEQLVAFQCK